MKLKKLVTAAAAAVLSVGMIVGVTGCSGDSGSSSNGNEVTQAPADNDEDGEADDKGFTGGAVADNPVDFAASLKLGWNLGNTLEATGGSGLMSETSWGQPMTTKELIEFVASSGFTTIRIPVSWSNHIDDEGKIDEKWMNRVTQVVDWSLESGLYVILNSHHDNDAYYPTEANYENAEAYIINIWTQIAENFKNYDEHLIFEVMNEPRLSGTAKEWWFNDNDKEGVEAIKCVDKLNQQFVNLIRESEGYNKTRYLMVPSICASAQNALNSAFFAPGDDANRIIVSVHAYSPYDFAMNANGYTEWDGSRNNELNFMEQLKKKFIDQGVGVVIDEFGSTNKDNTEDRIAWSKAYTERAAENGIACVLWDNGGTKVGEENFGMIDRDKFEIFYPEILNAMLESYK